MFLESLERPRQVLLLGATLADRRHRGEVLGVGHFQRPAIGAEGPVGLRERQPEAVLFVADTDKRRFRRPIHDEPGCGVRERCAVEADEKRVGLHVRWPRREQHRQRPAGR